METSCSTNRIISFSRIENGGEGSRKTEIKMGFVCVFMSDDYFPRWGVGAAAGQWGLVRLKGQASGRSIFIRLFKSPINSHLFDPPLLNYSAVKPFAHSSLFGVSLVYFHQLCYVSQTQIHVNASFHFSVTDDIWVLCRNPSANFTLCCWVVEIFTGALDTFPFFSGTSQVKTSTLMSSLSSEVNSRRSGVEHYILSWKQESKQTLPPSLAPALMRKWENKCRHQEMQVDLMVLKPTELSPWSLYMKVMTRPL